jgi:hypothetical protein
MLIGDWILETLSQLSGQTNSKNSMKIENFLINSLLVQKELQIDLNSTVSHNFLKNLNAHLMISNVFPLFFSHFSFSKPSRNFPPQLSGLMNFNN